MTKYGLTKKIESRIANVEYFTLAKASVECIITLCNGYIDLHEQHTKGRNNG